MGLWKEYVGSSGTEGCDFVWSDWDFQRFRFCKSGVILHQQQWEPSLLCTIISPPRDTSFEVEVMAVRTNVLEVLDQDSLLLSIHDLYPF